LGKHGAFLSEMAGTSPAMTAAKMEQCRGVRTQSSSHPGPHLRDRRLRRDRLLRKGVRCGVDHEDHV